MDRSGTSALALLMTVPVMTKERFAELVGVEVGVIRGMLDRGYLPTKKIGRHRFVNVAALQVECLELVGGMKTDSELESEGEEEDVVIPPGSPPARG